ncbi:hypothetical protein NECAME_01022 [Necator americanus]|uniref:Unspecific monooxygenase n=1 Tax=Necator americanus TaxID=51031 RepID=W2SK80_NECAM|nr:hypothetical protein NECAME_01022 [Necator americanus]ETN70074.1 hypothetical protein NECAME_01022 [Necator americanus]
MLLLDQFDEHKKSINYDQEPTNYLDAYLHEIHRRGKEGIQEGFIEKQCIAAIYDLYSAGLETIVITLRFCFLFILNYPHIQRKIHQEIDDVIGQERASYKLPKGTRVIPQFPSVHMDESIYPRAELVVPERHLKDGQFIKDDRITGFSVGKRACLGESLARMEFTSSQLL